MDNETLKYDSNNRSDRQHYEDKIEKNLNPHIKKSESNISESPIPKPILEVESNMTSWEASIDVNDSIRSDADLDLNDQIEFGEQAKRNSLVTKVYTTYQSPFNFLRKFTIFPSTETRLLKSSFTSFYPLTAALALIILTNQYMTIVHGFPVLLIAICIAIPICVLVWFIKKKMSFILIYIYTP